MQEQTRYSLDMPNPLLNRVRDLSLQRKKENKANKTQRAILLELIELGLSMLEPSNGSQSTPTETA
jgi:hypothetical protein